MYHFINDNFLTDIATVPPSYKMKHFHEHNRWELMFIYSGSCTLYESSPNLCVNSSFSYVVLSTLLLSSKDLTEWSLVYHSTLSYQRFYDLHSIHYDHLEGLHQLI